MTSIPSGLLGAIINAQYGDVIKKGSSLLQQFIAGVADVQESEAQSGITRDNETTRKVTSGEGKTTTDVTSRTVTTVDHVKQAQYLREVVNPQVKNLADGLLQGEIRIGKQTIPLGEIISLVEGLSKRSTGKEDVEIVIDLGNAQAEGTTATSDKPATPASDDLENLLKEVLDPKNNNKAGKLPEPGDIPDLLNKVFNPKGDNNIKDKPTDNLTNENPKKTKKTKKD